MNNPAGTLHFIKDTCGDATTSLYPGQLFGHSVTKTGFSSTLPKGYAGGAGANQWLNQSLFREHALSWQHTMLILAL
jgi:hypothetical protein